MVRRCEIKDIVLSDPIISEIFRSGFGVYLVGGFLRDILRGIKTNDIDFIIKGNMHELIPALSSIVDGKIIEFKKGGLIRIIAGDKTIDFTELKGGLIDNLSGRDFTMNAVAWSPDKGFIDLFGGVKDIKNRLIKGVSEKNFREDPLRLLRAYRFAGELGWKIHYRTRDIIRDLKSHIRLSAPERITLEFFKLLNSSNYLYALKLACSDGILNEIFSINNSQLKSNIKALSSLNAFLKKLPEIYGKTLDSPFSNGLTYTGLLRAEALLHGADLKDRRLSLSRAIAKRLQITNKLTSEYAISRFTDMTNIFHIFTEAGDAIIDFSILTKKIRLIHEAERFLNIKVVLPVDAIIELSGVKGGPELGEIVMELKRLQFVGIIKDKSEAIKWLSTK